MLIKINQRTKLFKINLNHPKDNWLMSTFCLAINKEDAENTFRDQYTIEYNKNLNIFIKQLKPKDKQDNWKWYEYAQNKKINKSLIISTKILK